jgi:hypothetical protein
MHISTYRDSNGKFKIMFNKIFQEHRHGAVEDFVKTIQNLPSRMAEIE